MRTPQLTTAPRRTATLVAVLLLCVAGQPVAAGGLSEARRQLRELERSLVAQERLVDGLAADLRDAAGRVMAQEDQHAAARIDVRHTESRIQRTAAEVAELRERLRHRARAVYKHGLPGWYAMLSSARSMADLRLKATYVGHLLAHDEQLARGLARATADLEAERAAREDLLREQASRLAEADREYRSLSSLVHEHREQVAELARARASARATVERLRAQVGTAGVAGLERAAGRGTPLTFAAWGERFLTALGVPVSRNNMVVVVAWQQAEYTRASWNPLATTYRMPDTTVINSHGVRNYTSLEQGIEATIRTLRRPGHGYQAILDALARSSGPMETAEAINASNWCRGCTGGRYMTSIVPAVAADYERFAAR